VTVIADDRWGGDPSQKSYDDIRADDSTIPESHGIDVLRNIDGKMLMRYSHNKGPCLFDQMLQLAAARRDALEYAKRQRAEAREAVRRARVAENLAKKRTAQIARAGLDAGLSYREAGLRVGIAASTLHNALQAAEES
jgi:hypothetical protein